uniref:Uncharacterized protein n=1 Tax=Candidatus Kentrum sp. MB TaxID=2138164 RepID=A0A450XLR4_9GAMM|nr:MAG: hypothetical protein BECKMB1821I_GA0114274_100323 [Candidatus Kentron sp. MB]VFK30273.1 MAG: hypothetical protein BECKMB1821G_GA0114241_10622 [Candidatus Kentron sp. MB]VFK74295.1 MAG: hypothetical protein BECKMB1821H_GA0114242_100323 [Candidatus Kentron sp. MB]
MLQLEREPGARQRPQALQTGDTHRTLPTWPLRRRRSPFDAGYIPHLPSSSKQFCTGTDPHR